MRVERFNSERGCYEMVESIGVVKFVGSTFQVDLSAGRNYPVIALYNNLLKLIDDTGDYYLYIPQDGNAVSAAGGASSGFLVVDDPSGQITQLIAETTANGAKRKRGLKSQLLNYLYHKRFTDR